MGVFFNAGSRIKLNENLSVLFEMEIEHETTFKIGDYHRNLDYRNLESLAFSIGIESIFMRK